MHADYLRHLFAVENNILKVNSEHGMGRLLIAHCRVSAKPVSNLEGDGVITLRLPIVAATQNLQHKFLYYSAGDIAQLNLALRSILQDIIGVVKALNSPKKIYLKAL